MAGIFDHMLFNDTHNLYDVSFFTDSIRTIVTNTPSIVDTWIFDTESLHSRTGNRLIVGLDVEWRPNNRYIENPVAIIQLCVGNRCLIFQFLHSPHIPHSLVNFLANPDYTFVGVGIGSDVQKLIGDYGLTVANHVDLRSLAAEVMGNWQLVNSGLKILAMVVLGKEIDKPKHISRSMWDNQWLTLPQVQYACIDAFISYEIGRSLNAAGQF